MHSSNSILRTYTEKVRQYLDSPDLDSKYDNDYLVRYILSPAMVDVQTRISMMGDNPIIVRHDITIVNDIEYYQLPPSIREVIRLTILDSDGHVIRDSLPRNEFNPHGPNWKLEGNLLAIRPRPSEGETLSLWYTPSGDMQALLGTAGNLEATQPR